MTFDLKHMLKAKEAFRRELSTRPLLEKLRLLDEMRARALILRRSTPAESTHGVVAESPAEYRTNSPGRRP